MAGCTNFCSYCIVPSRARAGAQPRARRTSSPRWRTWSPTASARSPCSARTSTPTASTCGAGEAPRAPSFPALLARSTPCRGPRARPLHDVAPQGPRRTTSSAAVAELPSVCEHVHLPAQAGSDRVLAAMRRGYTAARVPRARARPARRRARRQHHHGPHRRASPARPTTDFAATLDLVREAAFDAAFTFVFSPRARHGRRGASGPGARRRASASAWSA